MAPGAPSPAQLAEAFTVLAGPDGLTAKASTFTRHDVAMALSRQLPDLPGAQLPDLAERFLANEGYAVQVDRSERQPRWTIPDALQV